MATYNEIIAYVKSKYGFEPETCHIAHVKKLCGLDVKPAPNRSGERKKKCPKTKIEPIKEALKHFKIIE